MRDTIVPSLQCNILSLTVTKGATQDFISVAWHVFVHRVTQMSQMRIASVVHCFNPALLQLNFDYVLGIQFGRITTSKTASHAMNKIWTVLQC